MRKLVLASLMAESPAVRIEASQALVGMREASAVAELRRAIVVETDDVVRSQMQSDLRALERQH